LDTIRPWSALNNLDAGRAAAVCSPWAITSTDQAKQKAGANDHASLRQSLAPALKALALVDIHDCLGLAVPAVDP